jgi:hypothetical protein
MNPHNPLITTLLRKKWSIAGQSIELKLEDDALDDQFRIRVVLKCLSLRIEVLAFEPPRVTILPNLIVSRLNIFIKSPRLLHTFSAYL